MGKPKLTPEGVQQKTEEMYQLPDPELIQEAGDIRDDLIGWLLSNFDVAQHQHNFLGNLGLDYIYALSEQTERAVIHRWPITFKTTAANGMDASILASKWIKSKEDDEAGEPGDENGENRSIRGVHKGKLIIETGY